MGTEILVLLIPLALLHMAYEIYRSTAPGKRIRAFVVAALLSAAGIGLVIYNTGTVATFLPFFALLYLVLFLPLSLLAALARSIKAYREHQP